MQPIGNNIWIVYYGLEELGHYFRKILKKTDFFAIVVGKKFSGKSITIGSICYEIDPDFSKDDLVWSIDNFYERYNTKTKEMKASGKKFGVMLLDDFGSEMDQYDFLSDAARSISHLIQKSRTFHVGFFLTVPSADLINKNLRDRLPDFRIEVLGHNDREGYAVIKILRINSHLRTSKPFYNHLYGTLTGGIRNSWHPGEGKLVEYAVPLPPQEFSDWYIPARTELAERQLEASIALNQRKQKEKIGDTSKDYQDLCDKVLEEGARFFKEFRGKKILNRGLLTSRLGLTRDKITSLEAFMRDEGYIQ
jgi:hypothetical protein